MLTSKAKRKISESTTWLLPVFRVVELLICLNEQDPLKQAMKLVEVEIKEQVLERTLGCELFLVLLALLKRINLLPK